MNQPDGKSSNLISHPSPAQTAMMQLRSGSNSVTE
jgi:hypothetical protein